MKAGDVVPSDSRVRSYDLAKDDNVVLEQDDIDAVALESTPTIEIAQVHRPQGDSIGAFLSGSDKERCRKVRKGSS